MEIILSVIICFQIAFSIVLSVQLASVKNQLHEHIDAVEVSLKAKINGFLIVFQKNRDSK